jgi:hypothetical protein
MSSELVRSPDRPAASRRGGTRAKAAALVAAWFPARLVVASRVAAGDCLSAGGRRFRVGRGAGFGGARGPVGGKRYGVVRRCSHGGD